MSIAIRMEDCEDITGDTLAMIRAMVGEAPDEDTLAWRAEQALQRLKAAEDEESLDRVKARVWMAMKYLEGRMDRDMDAPL